MVIARGPHDVSRTSFSMPHLDSVHDMVQYRAELHRLRIYILYAEYMHDCVHGWVDALKNVSLSQWLTDACGRLSKNRRDHAQLEARQVDQQQSNR